jgi:hypothetical protein
MKQEPNGEMVYIGKISLLVIAACLTLGGGAVTFVVKEVWATSTWKMVAARQLDEQSEVVRVLQDHSHALTNMATSLDAVRNDVSLTKGELLAAIKQLRADHVRVADWQADKVKITERFDTLESRLAQIQKSVDSLINRMP